MSKQLTFDSSEVILRCVICKQELTPTTVWFRTSKSGHHRGMYCQKHFLLTRAHAWTRDIQLYSLLLEEEDIPTPHTGEECDICFLLILDRAMYHLSPGNSNG